MIDPSSVGKAMIDAARESTTRFSFINLEAAEQSLDMKQDAILTMLAITELHCPHLLATLPPVQVST